MSSSTLSALTILQADFAAGFSNEEDLVANSFDDTMLCAYKVEDRWFLKEWQITTDAGRYWLKNPMNPKGTAILVPNQYRGVYEIDKHGGRYDALCQRNGEVQVWRDDNEDQILNFNDITNFSSYIIGYKEQLCQSDNLELDECGGVFL